MEFSKELVWELQSYNRVNSELELSEMSTDMSRAAALCK
jgi:hypothetical protein